MTDGMVSTKTYLIVGAWLAGLMLLGVVLAEAGLPISKGLIVGVVLSLSLAKALLVALYYMHLKADRRLLALVIVGPFILVALAIGVVFSSVFVRL